jgi:hypothetical protein
MMKTAKTAFERALAKMSVAELKQLWTAVEERRLGGRFDPSLTDRQRLAAWARHQKWEAFKVRLAPLSLIEKSRIMLELEAGADPDTVLPPSKTQ